MRRRSVKDEVYSRLRKAILSGEYETGQRVIPQDIADRIAVSRTPVVQAMDRLHHEGLLELLPNGGFAVAGISEKAAQELIEIRTALETFAGRLAAARGVEPQKLVLLRQLNEEMKTEHARLSMARKGGRARIVERIIELNREVHYHITKAAENDRLVRLLNETLDLGATRPILLSLTDDELRRSILEHDEIIRKLEQGDAEAVSNILRKHMSLPLEAPIARIKSERYGLRS
ncbi:MAG: GntR family transcriptional regulator [Alphaproteobacteria bacterium]